MSSEAIQGINLKVPVFDFYVKLKTMEFPLKYFLGDMFMPGAWNSNFYIIIDIIFKKYRF